MIDAEGESAKEGGVLEITLFGVEDMVRMGPFAVRMFVGRRGIGDRGKLGVASQLTALDDCTTSMGAGWFVKPFPQAEHSCAIGGDRCAQVGDDEQEEEGVEYALKKTGVQGGHGGNGKPRIWALCVFKRLLRMPLRGEN